MVLGSFCLRLNNTNTTYIKTLKGNRLLGCLMPQEDFFKVVCNIQKLNQLSYVFHPRQCRNPGPNNYVVLHCSLRMLITAFSKHRVLFTLCKQWPKLGKYFPSCIKCYDLNCFGLLFLLWSYDSKSAICPYLQWDFRTFPMEFYICFMDWPYCMYRKTYSNAQSITC